MKLQTIQGLGCLSFLVSHVFGVIQRPLRPTGAFALRGGSDDHVADSPPGSSNLSDAPEAFIDSVNPRFEELHIPPERRAFLSLDKLQKAATTHGTKVGSTLRKQLKAMKEKSPKLHPLLKEQSSKVINAVGPTTAVILSMFLKSGELTLPAVYVLALLGSSAGFYLFLYFITIGYAFGILVPLLVGIYIYSERRLSHLTSAHGSLAILWSIRSASFFLWREYVNWPQLHEKVVEVNQMARFSSKVFCWFVYSFFYLCMVSPFIFRLRSESAWGVLGKVGLVVQATGFLLETIADYQKSAFKSRPGNRNQWCNAGLFAVSTFPNYLGESMFWTGAYVAGIGSYKKPQEWVMATTGLLFISIVVRGAIFSLGAKHRRKYGDNPDFAQFQESHNILGPKLFTKRENIITRSFSEVAP